MPSFPSSSRTLIPLFRRRGKLSASSKYSYDLLSMGQSRCEHGRTSRAVKLLERAHSASTSLLLLSLLKSTTRQFASLTPELLTSHMMPTRSCIEYHINGVYPCSIMSRADHKLFSLPCNNNQSFNVLRVTINATLFHNLMSIPLQKSSHTPPPTSMSQ